EVFVGEGRVENFVAMLVQVGRLDATRDRLPAVEEEDFHGVVVACCGRPGCACLSPGEYLWGLVREAGPSARWQETTREGLSWPRRTRRERSLGHPPGSPPERRFE